MEDRITALEREVSMLSQRVGDLAGRLDALTAAGVAIPAPAQAAKAAAATASAARPGPGLATLVGRSFIVMGGAFLLRALTQSSQGSGPGVMDDFGVALGMIYAAVWMVLAHRAAKAGHALDASVHAVVTSLIAFPMIWESTTRFHVLGPTGAALATLAFGGALLAGAASRGLPAFVWIGGGAAIATASGLILATRSVWALFSCALALSALALGISEAKRWHGGRWPIAGLLNLLCALVLVVNGRPNWEAVTAGTAAAVVLIVGGLFVALFAIRMAALRVPAGAFEVLQALALLGLSYAGGRWALRDVPAAQVALPAVVLVLGALCLVAALATLERRAGQGVDVACCTLFGAVLVVEGVRSLASAAVAGFVLALLALAGARLAAQAGRWPLRVSVALTATAAAGFSGALAMAWSALAGSGELPTSVAAPALGVLFAVAYAQLRRTEATGPTYQGAGLVLLILAAGLVAGAVSRGLAGVLPAGDLGALAVARTAALAGVIVLLSLAARIRPGEEIAWATYLFLGLAGLKVVADDFRHGRAATMFLTLAIYGGLLIVAPWMLRKARAGAPRSSP